MKEVEMSVSAIVGLVVAIIALLLSAIPIINNFSFVLAVIGLVLGIVGLVKIKKGKRTGSKVAISAIVISVISVGIVIASQAAYVAVLDEASESFNESADKVTGKSTDDLLKNDVTVTLGTFSATKDEFGTDKTVLPVSVTNKVSESKSYSIQIEAVDENGQRISDETVYANNLGANQTQELKAFEFVQSDKVESLKAATFKIVSVSQF